MTLQTARWVIIALCIAILAMFLAWAAARAWRALCEGWREALRLQEDRAIAQLERRARQQGRHRTGNTDPFPAVAAGERQPAGTQPEFATPADRAAHYQRPPLRNVGDWRPQR